MSGSMFEKDQDLDKQRLRSPVDSGKGDGEDGDQTSDIGDDGDDGDFSDMLSEMRILLPGAQMLSAFLIILPFNGGFAKIVHTEKLLFLATFVLALTSLVLLSAPAVQHRLMRPLKDRRRFKKVATTQIVAGSFTLAVALVLGTMLVISEVFGEGIGLVTAGFVGVLTTLAWWAVPTYLKRHAGV